MRNVKRCSRKTGPKLEKLVNPKPRFSVTVGEEVNDLFSNDDIAIQVLSRLPIECINELKCVSRRWFEILSHPFFRAANFQMSPRNLSGLIIQGTHFCEVCCFKYFDFKANYILFGKDGEITTTTTILDFLPENVVVIASCNGILLCCSFFEVYEHNHYDDFRAKRKVVRCDVTKEVVLYVCNPYTKEFTSLKPEGKYHNGCCYGFVCDSSGIINFDVIMIQCPLKKGKEPYLFQIYSSKTGAWRLSKEVCYLDERIHLHQSWHANGVFYWFTTNNNVLAFNLKEDSCQVIRLPGVLLYDQEGVCFGVSDGKLHYICFNLLELMIWNLEYDSVKPKWSLIHSKLIVEMDHYSMQVIKIPDYEPDPVNSQRKNPRFYPYGLHGDILFMRFFNSAITAYNIKTGKFENDICYCYQLENKLTYTPMLIPYCKSVLQVPLAKE